MATSEQNNQQTNTNRIVGLAETQKKLQIYDYEGSFFSYLKDLKNFSNNNTENDTELITKITEITFNLQQALFNFAPAINEELQYINEVILKETPSDDYFFNSSIISLEIDNPLIDFFPQWRRDRSKDNRYFEIDVFYRGF